QLAEARGALADRERTLAAERAVAQATLASTADAVLVTDESGRVLAFNQEFLRIFGLAPDEVEGACTDALAPRIAARLRDGDATPQAVGLVGASGEGLGRVETLDGRVLERSASEQGLQGHGGVRRVCSWRDVTARLEAEAALRDEAGILHFLNRTGAAIASTLDMAALLQTVIDAATQVSGAAFGAFLYRDEPEAPGRVCGEGTPMLALAGVSLPPSEQFDPMRLAALFGSAWRAGRTMRCDDISTEPRYRLTASWYGVHAGRAPLRSFLAVPVTLRSGAIVGGLFFGHPDPGVFTGRTERIVAGVAAHAGIALDNARLVAGMQRAARERERLEASEREARAESVRADIIKDEFLSTLSHELRTPLTAILGWAKVLLLQRADAATRRRGLEAIERNASAQVVMIEDLLDMSRIVSGKIRIEPRRCDLAAIADAALAGVRGSAQARRIVLEHRVEPAARHVHGDPARLQQVIANLLSNALKFTPEGGRVELAVGRVDEQVEIAVTDTGIGIEPEFVDHVFDQFRQADSSIRRRHGGLGLGLAIVRQLVALHGGAVGASSPGLGQGARFVVRLPAGDAPVEAARGDRAEAASPSGHFADVDLRGVRALVVDDDRDARELIAQLLLECGAEVVQAAGADEALAEFDRSPPDVLLSDIGMPGRDGYELIRAVRARGEARGGQIAAVALTAFARPEDRTRALLAGFQSHVAKPVDP
ncbi:MAG TPA: ATP-binding protein, partial [Burkholderiaceae bacterium]